jgi:hypothetical protein
VDIDPIIKISSWAGGALAGAIALWKIGVEVLRGRHGHLREEYKFARDFLQDLGENQRMHPFLRQKGYQAIAGDTRLSTHEIEYLLTLNDAARSLKDYVVGRPYLQHLVTSASNQVVFRDKFVHRTSRRWRKVLYFSLYLLCYLAVFAPLFLWAFRLVEASNAVLASSISAIPFFTAAVLSIREAVRIGRAEALVDNQQKYDQAVVLERSQF